MNDLAGFVCQTDPMNSFAGATFRPDIIENPVGSAF